MLTARIFSEGTQVNIWHRRQSSWHQEECVYSRHSFSASVCGLMGVHQSWAGMIFPGTLLEDTPALAQSSRPSSLGLHPPLGQVAPWPTLVLQAPGKHKIGDGAGLQPLEGKAQAELLEALALDFSPCFQSYQPASNRANGSSFWIFFFF